MADPLGTILTLAGVQDALLAHDDVTAWPSAVLTSFEQIGLLRRCSDAGHVVCDQCGERHTAPVNEQKLPNGSIRYFIVCPAAGRIELDEQRLRQWQIDFDRLAGLAAEALGIDGIPEMLAPQHAWRLGSITIEDGPLAAVMIRWTAGATPFAIGELRGVVPQKTVLFLLGLSQEPIGNGFAGVVPLSAVLRYRTGKFVIDRTRFEISVDLSDKGTDKPVVDEQRRTLTYRNKTCRFSSRQKNLWELFKRLNRRVGHLVYFDTMRQQGDIYGDYEVENNSIRSAMRRLRGHLIRAGMGRLAKCLKTGTSDGRGYAVLDLSAYDSNSH